MNATMDKDALDKLNCPSLTVPSIHDNLVLSTLSNAAGSVVEFLCTGDNDILSGPSVLVCTTVGKWNGSVPTCVANNDITTSITEDTTKSLLPTSTAIPEELEVEAVLIILWVAGGVLMVTLVVMIACILRSHSKYQRNRSERFPPRSHGNPRHGGVNPTFSAYDEIWTWIPVVTGNTDNCRNQPSASARENSVNQTNTSTELLRNLRLPTYSEAITTHVTSPAQNRNRTSDMTSLPVTSSTHRERSTQINTHRNGQQGVNDNPNNRPSSDRPQQYRVEAGGCDNRRHVPRQTSAPRGQQSGNANTNMTQSASESHHYETIPADLTTPHSNIRTNSNNVTRISVTTSRGSALQEARDLVNQAGAHARYSRPSASEYHCAAGGHTSSDSALQETRDIVTQVGAHAQHPHPSAPEYHCPAGGHNIRGESSRHNNPVSSAQIYPSAEQRRGVSVYRESRSTSQADYPHRQTTHRAPHDFQHSESSVFARYDENTRCLPTSTASNEHPPPYSAYWITEPPCRPAHDVTSGAMTSRVSSSVATMAVHTGLESHYF